jgi:hypothetical protein
MNTQRAFLIVWLGVFFTPLEIGNTKNTPHLSSVKSTAWGKGGKSIYTLEEIFRRRIYIGCMPLPWDFLKRPFFTPFTPFAPAVLQINEL